jgi:hypothetical protein
VDLNSSFEFNLYQATMSRNNAKAAISYWQSVEEVWLDRENEQMLQEIRSIIEEEIQNFQHFSKEIERLQLLSPFV